VVGVAAAGRGQGLQVLVPGQLADRGRGWGEYGELVLVGMVFFVPPKIVSAYPNMASSFFSIRPFLDLFESKWLFEYKKR